MDETVENSPETDDFASAYSEATNDRLGGDTPSTETPAEASATDPVKESTESPDKKNSTTEATTAADDKATDVEDKAAGKGKDDGKTNRSTSKQNSINAQRRIAAKKARQARMENIRREHEGLKNSEIANEPSVQMRMRNLEDRYGDLQAQERDEKYNQFTDKVYEAYGDDVDTANTAIDAIDRVADYVNEHEPMVRKIMARQGGLKVLGTWAVGMTKYPALRKQWFGMLDSEKEKTLLGLYNKVNTPKAAVNNPANSAVNNPPKVTNAPVAASGNQGAITGDTDDFGVALAQVKQMRKSSAW